MRREWKSTITTMLTGRGIVLRCRVDVEWIGRPASQHDRDAALVEAERARKFGRVLRRRKA